MAALALFTKMSAGLRIGLLVVVAVAAVVVLLWSKRGEIADQMAHDSAPPPPADQLPSSGNGPVA